MSHLSIRTDRKAATLTLSLVGELDAQTAEQFRLAVLDAERSPAAIIVLDLTEVRFVDSSGLVALLMAARRGEREGTRLRMRAGSGEIRRLLEVTAIDDRLNLID